MCWPALHALNCQASLARMLAHQSYKLEGVGSSRLGHEVLLPQVAGHGVALAKHELAMCASLGLSRSKARRVAHPSYKHEPLAEESSKIPVPAIERIVFDAGLKRKQGEIEVKDSKKLITAVKEKISKAEEVFHNIVMRLTDHSEMGDALGVSRENLELQMSNANFDNDDDAVKLSLLYIIFCIPLSNANSVKIDPKFFSLADNLDDFNDFPWGMLSWEATRAAIYLSSIASKFTTKYDQAIPRMASWTTADNVKFDDVMSAFTAVGEAQGPMGCAAIFEEPKGCVSITTSQDFYPPTELRSPSGGSFKKRFEDRWLQ
ncbi:hypothetical protein TIFTF001_014305 [Ficus carica]|uniref:DUF1985 domain-containing protein n=1 Tax=Ficus carica TaxID=3494 RepID=A0AA88A3I0_FICCA|nr:hypothetical protein TIFTF001_014305 [Ficus carica]